MPPLVTILLLLLALVLFLFAAFDVLKNMPKVNPLALGLAVWVFVQLLALIAHAPKTP